MIHFRGILKSWIGRKTGWVSGRWLYTHPSEKYEFVNWDDEIPNISGKIKLMATKPPTRFQDFNDQMTWMIWGSWLRKPPLGLSPWRHEDIISFFCGWSYERRECRCLVDRSLLLAATYKKSWSSANSSNYAAHPSECLKVCCSFAKLCVNHDSPIWWATYPVVAPLLAMEYSSYEPSYGCHSSCQWQTRFFCQGKRTNPWFSEIPGVSYMGVSIVMGNPQ